MPTKPANRKNTKPAKNTATPSNVSALSSITSEDFDKQSEQLAGQERTAKLQLASKKVEGVLIKGQEQDVKNTALADRVNHAEAVRGVQSQTMAQKLSQENNQLTFATAETALKQESLNIQKEGLESYNTFGRDMLATQKDLYAAKLQAARASVQNFIASAQNEAAQLAGEVIDV
ncbi:MAG: hypothetical protein DCF25_06590 [Leptolyngbya foveolarum]|uniref:Uncharacterized protein n=1 Tax=Leptolyngbya foveolarum TaxID=47253 RepID=A0A2W4UIV8_9CYAN|nr:MAG: hypothetical protein DCF25_06590 [Leptolyngbya foveolarum]